MAFVPEGRRDRSLARSAWDCATKEPSRRARSEGDFISVDGTDSPRRAHRFDDWSDEISNTIAENILACVHQTFLATRLLRISALVSRRFRKRSVTSSSNSNIIGRQLFKLCLVIPYPTGRFSWWTLFQALRARLLSCCPSGTKYILRAEALIKLALMGLSPG
jgi:hypothetical protein